MKIILLGASGLVGSELKNHFKSHELIAVDIDQLDLGDSAAVKDFFSKNRADVLINAFGKNEHVDSKNLNQKTVLNISDEEILSYFNINSLYLFRVCREFVCNNKKGKVFNFSSLYGHHVPRPTYYNGSHKSIGYCLSKAAVVMLTKYFAVHFPDFEFIDIVLGGVENNQAESFVTNYINDVPKARMLNVKEIGPIIEGLFQSSYITGTSIFIDGGKNLM
jgi:NAD(P)-dependent dehydrogenase (short-subunit alcohol dehydrogenase family)